MYNGEVMMKGKSKLMMLRMKQKSKEALRSITWWLKGHMCDGISYVSSSADFNEI